MGRCFANFAFEKLNITMFCFCVSVMLQIAAAAAHKLCQDCASPPPSAATVTAAQQNLTVGRWRICHGKQPGKTLNPPPANAMWKQPRQTCIVFKQPVPAAVTLQRT